MKTQLCTLKARGWLQSWVQAQSTVMQPMKFSSATLRPFALKIISLRAFRILKISCKPKRVHHAVFTKTASDATGRHLEALLA